MQGSKTTFAFIFCSSQKMIRREFKRVGERLGHVTTKTS